MTFTIIDNGLCNKAGHHYSFDKMLVEADPTIKVLGMRNMSQAILSEGWAEGALTDWTYANKPEWIDTFIDFSEMFCGDLLYPLRYIQGPILIHTSNPWIIYGLAKYLIGIEGSLAVKIILCLPGIRDENGNPTLQAVLYAKAIRELRKWGGKFEIAVQTEWTIADGTVCGIMPSICPTFPLHQVEPKGVEDAPVFGFLGHSNGVKGLSLLLQAAQLTPEIQYFCQLNPVLANPIGLPNVKVIEGELNDRYYTDTLSKMDAVVLPYNRDYYKNHMSAVFLESICSGRPVIIPADTWMEFEAKRLGVGYESFESGSAASLLMAIRAMRDKWPEAHTKSIAALQTVREKYNVNRFIKWVES